MEELNTNLTVQQTAAPESPLPQKPPVPLRDRVLAFALLALGYLVCRFQIHDWPLLGLVYGLIFYGLTAWHFRGRAGRRAWGVWAVGLLFLLAHLLTDNGPVRFFARWLALLLPLLRPVARPAPVGLRGLLCRGQLRGGSAGGHVRPRSLQGGYPHAFLEA